MISKCLSKCHVKVTRCYSIWIWFIEISIFPTLRMWELVLSETLPWGSLALFHVELGRRCTETLTNYGYLESLIFECTGLMDTSTWSSFSSSSGSSQSLVTNCSASLHTQNIEVYYEVKLKWLMVDMKDSDSDACQGRQQATHEHEVSVLEFLIADHFLFLLG